MKFCEVLKGKRLKLQNGKKKKNKKKQPSLFLALPLPCWQLSALFFFLFSV